MTKGYLLSATAFLVYVFFFWGCFRFALGRSLLKKYRFFCLDLLAAAVLMFFFFALLLRGNQYVYYWDSGGFWTDSYQTCRQIFSDPDGALKSIWDSIAERDYNLILALILSFPMKIIGDSYNRYVLLNFLVFMVPAWYLLCGTVLLYREKHPEPALSLRLVQVLLIGLLLTFNTMYIAMLIGYISAGCLVPAACAMLLAVDYQAGDFDRRQIFRDILISLNLLLAFLFRRFFAYYGIGFAIALLFLSVVQVHQTAPDMRKKAAKHALWNYLLTGMTAAVLLLTVFRSMVVRILSHDYSVEYSGHDDSMANKYASVLVMFGWGIAAVGLAGSVLSFVHRRNRTAVVFCGLTTIFTMVFFFTVQAMGTHHVYTLCIPVFLLLLNGTLELTACVPACPPRWRQAFAAACILFWSFGSAKCYFPSLRTTLHVENLKVYSENYSPLRRNDLAELNRLVNYLNDIRMPDKAVYVLASSGILNDDILLSVKKPEEDLAVQDLAMASQYDLRDGFSSNFLRATVIVTTRPIQTHLVSGTQEVVRFLASEVMDPTSCIGRHFQQQPETFQLDEGVTVYIYFKTSPFEESDLQYMADYFSDYYPGHEDIFAQRILGGQ
jgi:hypothetical protein